MSRDDQTGGNAPRQGTMIRQSRFGATSYDTVALTRFPPPDFLTPTQRNLWIAALGDVPLEFFRARHIPVMIQYVRAVERMMFYSDRFEEDPEDAISLSRWDKMLKICYRLENHLSLNTGALISLVVRARTELKLANQQKNAREAGEDESNKRRGLTYVGH
jgi:hypothetical protein